MLQVTLFSLEHLLINKTNRKILLFGILLFLPLFCCGNNIANTPQWYVSKSDYDPNKIDVLYFVSTDVLSAKDDKGNVSWQSLLIPEDVASMTGEIAWVENNMFYNDFNFSAPLYHQFTFDAICQLSKDSFNIVYKKVANEAITAFDYYMRHHNNGRPFILAGFSQGAMLTLDILKHMTDNEFSRLIACYTLGYRLTEEDLNHPHINAAQGEKDCGVVISFNSVQTPEAPHHISMITTRKPHSSLMQASPSTTSTIGIYFSIVQ